MRVLSLTMEEAHRYKVISEVNEAAEILGLSQRQVYRIKERIQKEGSKGVIHRSKGRKSPHWLIRLWIHRTGKIRCRIDPPP
jgi:hypothetical protein